MNKLTCESPSKSGFGRTRSLLIVGCLQTALLLVGSSAHSMQLGNSPGSPSPGLKAPGTGAAASPAADEPATSAVLGGDRISMPSAQAAATAVAGMVEKRDFTKLWTMTSDASRLHVANQIASAQATPDGVQQLASLLHMREPDVRMLSPEEYFVTVLQLSEESGPATVSDLHTDGNRASFHLHQADKDVLDHLVFENGGWRFSLD